MISFSYRIGFYCGDLLRLFPFFARDYLIVGKSSHLSRLEEWLKNGSKRFRAYQKLSGFSLGLNVGLSGMVLIDNPKYLWISNDRRVCFHYLDLHGRTDIDVYRNVIVIVGSYEAKLKLIALGFRSDWVLAIGLFDQQDDIGHVEYQSVNTLKSIETFFRIIEK